MDNYLKLRQRYGNYNSYERLVGPKALVVSIQQLTEVVSAALLDILERLERLENES